MGPLSEKLWVKVKIKRRITALHQVGEGLKGGKP